MTETMLESEEATLIIQAQDGDREAYGALVLAYHNATINVIYRFCGDARLAEDAAQVAFIKAWQHLPAYRQGGSFRSWLFRIAVNTASDMLRREKLPQELDEQTLLAPGEGLEAGLEQAEQGELVRRAVLALPEASRAVIVLREYEGLTYQEIATALDIPLGTVMSRLSYARNRLSEILKPIVEEA